MSFESLRLDQTRFMPAPLEQRLLGLLGRGAGALLLALVAAIWVSLLTWSVSDPSLTHATGGAVHNWMGPVGAIVSDLLLQTLGFAAVILTLAPMFWSLELVRGEAVWNFRTKAAFVPVSVVLIAGALSSLPVLPGWPLHHGMGGMLGDIMLRLVSSVFGLINPIQAGIASGILFAATGLSTMAQSIGAELRDLRLMMVSLMTFRGGGTGGSWHENLKAEAGRLRDHLQPAAQTNHMGYAAEPAQSGAGYYPAEYAHQDNSGEYADDSDWHNERQEPSFGTAFAPRAPTLHAPVMPVAPPARGAIKTAMYSLWSMRQPAVVQQAAPAAPDDNDFDFAAHAGTALADFDRLNDPASTTADSSSAMARRFAASTSAAGARIEPDTAPRGPAKKPAFLRDWKVRAAEPVYKRPSLNILKRATPSRAGAELSQTALRGTARLLEDVLNDFGVKGEMRDVRPGPVVTLFEFEPARGTKTSRIVALADDIARSMSVTSVRVAVVPGRSVIGIELPNVKREMVMLRDIFEADAYRASEAILPIVLGKSIGGDAIVADLARMPHLLVAGTTGSGKSVGVNAMILSLLYRHSPEHCRLLMIDPKMLELSVYNGIPHLLTPVVTDPAKAVSALNWAVSEMEERYKRMSKLSVRNIDAFNTRVRDAQKRGESLSRTVQTGFDRQTGAAIYESQDMALEPMPYIVIIVDEFADLMTVAGKDIEIAVQRLAQMARAAGIHLVMATQRPSVDIITGTIKANFPTRISFKVTSKIDSRTILNEQGAEQLLGAGDMLYSSGSGQIVRVHGPFVSDEEVESIAESLRIQGAPVYVDDMFDQPGPVASGGGAGGSRSDGEDDLYDRAVALVVRDQKASTSYIQRRLSIGYNRAADLMERMEQDGLVSAPNHSGKREILAGG
jgi:DNA segregation ATPase FtsK/SpoIIIE, S-DNA-T family